MSSAHSHSIWKKYGYGWVTLGFFLVTLAGHWVFGWFSYVDEQLQHGAPVEVSGLRTIGLRSKRWSISDARRS